MRMRKGGEMPKYLFKSSLNAEGARGTIKDGGTGRRDAVRTAIESSGGSLEAYYYAFGSVDAYVIVDYPSHAQAVAASMAVAAAGTGSVETVVLLEPEEIDEAAQIHTNYRPPGG
jgi:uncharacterized protein with GYD domain